MKYCMHFIVHGTVLRISTDCDPLAEAATDVMSPFKCDREPPSATLDAVLCSFSDRSEIADVIPESAQLISEPAGVATPNPNTVVWPWPCRHYRYGRTSIVDFGDDGLVEVDFSRQTASAFVAAAALPVRRMYMVQLVVVVLLKNAGLFAIHASAAERDGRGLLFAGRSGRGKTTCLLTMLRAGYRYLSDDGPLLRRTNDGGIEVLAFPTAIAAAQKTLDMIGESSSIPHVVESPMNQKWRVEKKVSPYGGGSCRPAVLVFPTVVDWPTSHLEPMAKSRALEELLPQGFLTMERETAREQLRLFTELLESVGCYRLYFGADVDELPRLIGGLFEAGLADVRRVPASVAPAFLPLDVDRAPISRSPVAAAPTVSPEP